MSSTFKNRIPKRKYRQRAQPQARQHLGLLQKKKDYKLRAKNYHQKQDKLNFFKQKANLRNQDEFYFKMLNGKRNDSGKHIEQDEDSDFDQKQFRSAMKTENYNVVKLQRSIVQKKIQRLRGDLHLLETDRKLNNHKIFVNSQQQLAQFNAEKYFNTSKQLIDNKILHYDPNSQKLDIETQNNGTLKNKYKKLSEYLQREQKLTKLLMKIGYQKNLLSKQRKMIKKHGKNKIHKFFLQRKK